MINWKDYLPPTRIGSIECGRGTAATLVGPGDIKVEYTPRDAFRVCARGNLALSSVRVLTKEDREKRILRMVSYDLGK